MTTSWTKSTTQRDATQGQRVLTDTFYNVPGIAEEVNRTRTGKIAKPCKKVEKKIDGVSYDVPGMVDEISRRSNGSWRAP
eukprot:gene22038-8632_t